AQGLPSLHCGVDESPTSRIPSPLFPVPQASNLSSIVLLKFSLNNQHTVNPIAGTILPASLPPTSVVDAVESNEIHTPFCRSENPESNCSNRRSSLKKLPERDIVPPVADYSHQQPLIENANLR